MDWIERLFHISPDGGNGYFEYLILAVVLLAVVYPLRHRIRSFLGTRILARIRRVGRSAGRQPLRRT
jgi:hypothetical protein